LKGSTKEKRKRAKDKTISLTSENEGLKFVLVDGREMNKMEEKKESTLPMRVLLITIGIGAIVLVRFILFSE
jgi:hypothetical protein